MKLIRSNFALQRCSSSRIVQFILCFSFFIFSFISFSLFSCFPSSSISLDLLLFSQSTLILFLLLFYLWLFRDSFVLRVWFSLRIPSVLLRNLPDSLAMNLLTCTYTHTHTDIYAHTRAYIHALFERNFRFYRNVHSLDNSLSPSITSCKSYSRYI